MSCDLGPARLYFDTSRQTREIEEFLTDITLFWWAWACLQKNVKKKRDKSASLLHSHLLSLGLLDRLFLFRIDSAQVLVSAMITQKRAKEIVCLVDVWRLLPTVQIAEHGEWNLNNKKCGQSKKKMKAYIYTFAIWSLWEHVVVILLLHYFVFVFVDSFAKLKKESLTHSLSDKVSYWAVLDS